MEFNNGEHSIVATFSKEQDASKAAEALKNAGITELSLEKVERFGIGDNLQVKEEQNSVEDTVKSASSVLLASDPSLNEYNLEQRGAGEGAVILSVKTGSSKLNQALKIVQKYGGEI